jgi:5-methylthioadenosine/S-adenosylhomocysteine deaminase
MGLRRSVLVRGGTVVPMADRGVQLQADVRIEEGRIAAVAPGLDSEAGCDVLDATDALVLPGFVQAHVHVVQSLARHRAEGLPLLRWLAERIWPYEAALQPEEVAAAARLGIAELLSGGTTSALDMGTTHDQDAVFSAAAELGIRLTSGKCHMDTGNGVPSGLLEDRDESLARAEALASRWHGSASGRLRYAVAPRFVLSCSPELLAGAVALARPNGYLLHTHSSESAEETQAAREAEVRLLSRQRTGVAHCPGANLKLGSGIADVPRLLRHGVRIGLGADGPPCNNRLSIFHEMALAGTLHNLAHGPGAVDPWTVLEMATWRGAEVLGLGEEVGRLLPGWKADVVVLSCSSLAMEPAGDPAAMVVFGGGVESVRHVVVDGSVVVRNGELVTADVSAIRREARGAAVALTHRLGWS